MQAKKKILHLITGLEVGGTEMMLLRLLPEMQNDFDNQVCCMIGKGIIGKKLEEKEIPVHYLLLKHPFDIGCILRFKKITTSIQPDILVTYLIHADLFGRIFGRLFGIRKIVCSERGALLQWEFLRFFDRLTNSLVNKYVVQTFAAKQELIKKLHVPEERFEVIPNAIDTSEYDFEIDDEAKKRALGINRDNLNIVCVSNLRRGKGHEYLLEAFEDIYKKNKRINLLIVGDGEKREILKKQISTYTSKNNIYFLGKRDDVKEILKISDIFILPTLGEGMSNAIMEAMASRLAIITTDINSNRELIKDGEDGFLIPTRNTTLLTEKIQFLIQNNNTRMLLGTTAWKKIKDTFSIDIIAKKWIAYLKSVN